jgi:hypothetical protein
MIHEGAVTVGNELRVGYALSDRARNFHRNGAFWQQSVRRGPAPRMLISINAASGGGDIFLLLVVIASLYHSDRGGAVTTGYRVHKMKFLVYTVRDIRVGWAAAALG